MIPFVTHNVTQMVKIKKWVGR